MTDNAAITAAYIWAVVLAAPVGLVSGFWSGTVRAGLYGFTGAFIPAVVTFLAIDIVREHERKRAHFEERLFAALEGIEVKLDELGLELAEAEDKSDADP
jgi:hypothetical protein